MNLITNLQATAVPYRVWGLRRKLDQVQQLSAWESAWESTSGSSWHPCLPSLLPLCHFLNGLQLVHKDLCILINAMAEVISPVWCINNMLSNRVLTHTKQNLCLRGSSDLNWKILSAGPAFCDWGLGSWFGVHPLHSTPGGKCRRGVHQLHYTPLHNSTQNQGVVYYRVTLNPHQVESVEQGCINNSTPQVHYTPRGKCRGPE